MCWGKVLFGEIRGGSACTKPTSGIPHGRFGKRMYFRNAGLFPRCRSAFRERTGVSETDSCVLKAALTRPNTHTRTQIHKYTHTEIHTHRKVDRPGMTPTTTTSQQVPCPTATSKQTRAGTKYPAQGTPPHSDKARGPGCIHRTQTNHKAIQTPTNAWESTRIHIIPLDPCKSLMTGQQYSSGRPIHCGADKIGRDEVILL